MLFCCCSNNREDEDEILKDLTSKLKITKSILNEFMNEEQKLGMKEVDVLELIKETLDKTDKNEIPKHHLKEILENLKRVDSNQVYYFLSKDCFFKDQTRTKYDFDKISTFYMLYGGGSEYE